MLDLKDFEKITDEFNLHYWQLKKPFKPLNQEISYNAIIESRMFDKYKFDVKIFIKDSKIVVNTIAVKEIYQAPETAYKMIIEHAFKNKLN